PGDAAPDSCDRSASPGRVPTFVLLSMINLSRGNRPLTRCPNQLWSGRCPTQEDVSVTITDGILTFTNSALRNFAMGFEPHPDGSFSQMHVDIGGDVVDIRGRIVGDTLDADVANAPCEHHWHLQKKTDGLMPASRCPFRSGAREKSRLLGIGCDTRS